MNPNTLKALLLIAGKKDVRYYLNGIFIDHVKRVAVATNGSILLVVQLEPDDYALASVIIARTAVENAVKIKNGQMMIEADGRVKLGCMESKPVEGRYPDWLRAIPEKTSGETGDYDLQLLDTMQKAAQLITGRKFPGVKINQNGGGAAVIGIADNALGVVMPARIAESATASVAVMQAVIRGNKVQQ